MSRKEGGGGGGGGGVAVTIDKCIIVRPKFHPSPLMQVMNSGSARHSLYFAQNLVGTFNFNDLAEAPDQKCGSNW